MGGSREGYPRIPGMLKECRWTNHLPVNGRPSEKAKWHVNTQELSTPGSHWSATHDSITHYLEVFGRFQCDRNTGQWSLPDGDGKA